MNVGEIALWAIVAVGLCALAFAGYAVRGELRLRQESKRRLQEAMDRERTRLANVRRDEALWHEGLRKSVPDIRPYIPPLRKLSAYREPTRIKRANDVTAPVTDDASWLVPLSIALSGTPAPYDAPSPSSFVGAGGDFGGAGASGSFDVASVDATSFDP